MIEPTTGLKATTCGEPAKYISGYTSHNLAEGTEVFIQLCAVKGADEICGIAYSGHA